MKLIRILLFVMSFFFASQVAAQTVCITKTGEKYHKTSCRFLKYSKKETTIKKAKALGYIACKVCKPTLKNTNVSPKDSSLSITPKEESSKSNKKTIVSQCTGKTKTGKRCKRKTKNAHGRCYQH